MTVIINTYAENNRKTKNVRRSSRVIFSLNTNLAKEKMQYKIRIQENKEPVNSLGFIKTERLEKNSKVCAEYFPLNKNKQRKHRPPHKKAKISLLYTILKNPRINVATKTATTSEISIIFFFNACFCILIL